MCALLDFEDPIDILIHLMIGSEGTLGFISEVTLKTISIHPFTSTALVTFKNKKDAQIGVKVCKDVGASAVEWMNDELICKARKLEGLKSITQPIDCGGVTLLIEINSASEIGLRKILTRLENLLHLYNEDRYRPSPMLKKLIEKNKTFF